MMWTVTRFILCLCVLLMLSMLQVEAAPPVLDGLTAGNAPAVSGSASPQTEALINQARDQYNLPPLRADGRLEAAAAYHNHWMADHSVFCHECPGEPSVAQRLYSAGYIHNGLGEIVGAGYQTPEDVVAGWMASQGHHDIILGAYRDVGCDMLYQPGSQWTWYWTCDFGNTDEPIPAATARPTATFYPTPTPLVIAPRPTSSPLPTRTPYSYRPTPTAYVPPTPPPAAPPTATAVPSGATRRAYVAVNADRQALDLQSQLCAWNGGADCAWQSPYTVVVLRPDAMAFAQRNFDRLCGSRFAGVACD